MMESLQQILHQLRPVGLEEFGLVAGLDQLVDGWNQRSRGRCHYGLELAGTLDDLPDNLNVSLYRIVQESLTNAAKHGQATEVIVRLRRAAAIELTVDDDGVPDDAPPAEPGLGVLGMHERGHALGGSFSLTSRAPRGMRVSVSIPLAATSMQMTNPHDATAAARR
jgi:protein-histidine pros-kinase